MPAWIHLLAWISLITGFVCALGIAIHTARRPQSMWIMSVVWPITGLYLGPVAVHLYRKSLPVSARDATSHPMHGAQRRFQDTPPTMLQNLIAVFHCGAGCTLGDILAESLVPAFGLAFAGEFGTKLICDFFLAWLIGIAFQYVTIAPMRGLSFGPGLIAAARADTISIALFEIGMFAWMALTHYILFPASRLGPGSAIFWFMMQIAMILGTVTALPANAWLIRKGWKEKMPPLDPSQLAVEAPSARRAA
jgi:hypothetical protein